MAQLITAEAVCTRVLVADGDRLFRDGLTQLLAHGAGIEVVGTAAGAVEVRALMMMTRPAVVVLATGIPGVMGLIREIRQERPETAVLVLQPAEGEYRAIEALGAGANGYLLRSCGIETVAAAIHALAAGETVISAAVAEHIFSTAQSMEPDLGELDGLTTREVEVLRLIAGGSAYKQVAIRMSISYKTVRNYVSHIYEKLSIYDRSQIALYAVRKGLIDAAGTARV